MRGDDLVSGAAGDLGHAIELPGETAGARPVAERNSTINSPISASGPERECRRRLVLGKLSNRAR
jgi:hypothetical protein